MKLVNCQNYFNMKSFKEVCQLLEAGETVEVYIDCIGHSRNNYEQEKYHDAIVGKYEDRVKVEIKEGSHSYSYKYKLKKEEIKMKVIKVVDEKTLKMLEEQSALTVEGLIEEDAPEFMNWVKQYSPVTSEIVYIIKGKTMNEVYGLTEENAYRDDLTLQAIPLNLIKDVSAIILPRFQIEGRWFDDIVENNAMKEGMNHG